MVLSQQSIGALNSHGQLLLDKGIGIRIVLFITILQNKQKVPCLSREINEIQKTNKYHSKSDEIHVGLGVM